MNWIENYQNLLEKDKDLFRDCINRLFSQSFLVSSREQDKKYYRFCEKHIELMKNYLQIAGWQIQHKKTHGVISIYNVLERNKKNFTLAESIFLFILRLLYDEKRNELSLLQQLTVTNREVFEKYIALQIKNRLPAQDEYQRIMKMFQAYSLIEWKRGNWIDEDSVFVLYPSLLSAISPEAIEAIYKWILQYEEIEGDESEDFNETKVD